MIELLANADPFTVPMLAMLGTRTAEGLSLRNAEELRFKESDRLATVVENLRRMGVRVELHPDGFDIPGGQRLQGTEVDSFGDHRIAMAFTVAALVAEGKTVLRHSEVAAVSFPDFFERLESIVER